ncbi:MAG: hypothetical protein PHQ74_14240 [Crocinitomicaceae bacterium]|nr:hypothetical protein [Crocinitomicaceae bacterium]
MIKIVLNPLGNTPTVYRDYDVYLIIFRNLDEQKIPVENPFLEPELNHHLSASEQLALDIIQKSKESGRK